MKSYLHLIILFILISGNLSFAQSNPANSGAAPSLEDSLRNLNKVGEGQMKWTFFNLYIAEYWSAKPTFDLRNSLALRLKYQRHLKGKLIAERTGVEMEYVGIKSSKIPKWVEELKNIFPDVDDGTVLTGFYDPSSGVTRFYKNEQKIGQVEGKDFGEAFFSIWLSEGTREPKLRKKLLGIN